MFDELVGHLIVCYGSRFDNIWYQKFRTKMMMTARRFNESHGTERNYYWVNQFCQKKNIDYRVKMRKLKKYLANNNQKRPLRVAFPTLSISNDHDMQKRANDQVLSTLQDTKQ